MTAACPLILWLSAKSSMGRGDVSVPFLHLNAVPGPPTEIEVVANVVSVWQNPETPNGVITGFDVRISLLNEDASTNGTIYITSLLPDTLYHVLRTSEIPTNSIISFEV